MDAQAILKKMRAQREFVVPLEGGKSVTLLRPTDMECHRDLFQIKPAKATEKVKVELHLDTDKVHNYATAWSGFTEADLLGADGGSDAVGFHAELLQEYLANHTTHAHALVTAMYEAIATYLNSKATAEKN